jgi:L-asparaginase II
MLAGAGRFDTVVTQALGQAAFVKLGAEGVYCGALPSLGLGFALKCDDGAVRAAQAATAALLRHLLGPNEMLDRLANPALTNWNGLAVGEIRSRLA